MVNPMRYFRTPKPLSKRAFYLIILVSLVGTFFIATDKREVVLIYVSVALIATLHFFVYVLRERNILRKTWQYSFARFLSLYLPSSLFFGYLPGLQGISLGIRLIIAAIVAGIALVGIHFQESFQHNRGN